MEKWTDTQNFADAGEKSTLIASAHRAAIRSIERVVTETVTPHDPQYAAEGIEKMLRTGGVLALTGAGVTDAGGAGIGDQCHRFAAPDAIQHAFGLANMETLSLQKHKN